MMTSHRIAVIDRGTRLEVAYRFPGLCTSKPGSIELLFSHMDNIMKTRTGPGNIVWFTSANNEDGIVLMRSLLLDTITKKSLLVIHCGGGENKSLKVWLEHIDSSKVGKLLPSMTEWVPIYSTILPLRAGKPIRE